MVKITPMKRPLALVVAGLALVVSVQAQDTVSPSAPAPTADTAALVARIAELEQQLDACHQQADVTTQPATNMAQPAQAYVPAARYGGGGFRMAAEPRLTCEDYSKSYFDRHPTMAKVCGRGEVHPDAEMPAVAPQEAMPAEAVSGTQGL